MALVFVVVVGSLAPLPIAQLYFSRVRAVLEDERPPDAGRAVRERPAP
ncbi:hypothetical protein [Amycolatopsis sp. NPDC003731]